MTATLAQPKRFILLTACITFISLVVALAAALRPAQSVDVSVPAAQAVPVAPAAHFARQTEGVRGVLAALPEPVPVPTAPGAPAAEVAHGTKSATSQPAAGNSLIWLGLAFAAALVVTPLLALRRRGLCLQPAVS